MKKIAIQPFRVLPDQKVRLDQWPTAVKPIYDDAAHYQALLQTHVSKLSRLQSLLYARDREAILLIFQAMDAAGKDGAIKHIMSGINPQGCQVFSFKHPSAQDLDHDFLWRTTQVLPERGRIGIFNRSYYEEVLIVRVHPEILAAQRLPDDVGSGKRFWEGRFASINDLERHLHRNGTRVLKFFLHLSKDEQRRRFIERIDNPAKNWKFSQADVEERRHWDDYMAAYEDCLRHTSTADAPWYVIPADDKLNARLIISQVIVQTLEGLKMAYPETDATRRAELLAIRDGLEQEGRDAEGGKAARKSKKAKRDAA
jgi:PPK2 family polyphosphate:nucleotide phosphotransferase